MYLKLNKIIMMCMMNALSHWFLKHLKEQKQLVSHTDKLVQEKHLQ